MIEVISKSTPRATLDGISLKLHKIKNSQYMAISCFPLDSKLGIHNLYVSNDNSSCIQPLEVLKRKIPVRELTLPDKFVFLSPEDIKRVEEENKRLSMLWNTLRKPLWEGNFVPPLHSSITTYFGVLRIINKKVRSVHTGIDYKAPSGEPVKVINSGIVVLKDELFLPGKTVIVDHGGGIFSLYMHLSDFNCEKNQMVKKGDIIGYVGSTGRSVSAHLHLSVKINGKNIDPLSLFLLSIPE